jgi:hypothetical protein
MLRGHLLVLSAVMAMVHLVGIRAVTMAGLMVVTEVLEDTNNPDTMVTTALAALAALAAGGKTSEGYMALTRKSRLDWSGYNDESLCTRGLCL